MPRASVLIAVHNGEPYLHEAVSSVLTQTFSDLELLVVDDGSDDRTAEILASFDDERLRILRNPERQGQVPSLNRGLSEARGRYVARLDADDLCTPDRLERQIAVLDAEPEVAVVGSWAKLVDGDGAAIGHMRQSLRDYVDFLYWNLVAWVLIAHPSATFRKDVVLELGGYDESLGPSEDKDLWRRLALARYEGRIVERELIAYRLHGAQLSRVQRERQRMNDARSHEAFLGALAPDVDAHQLRLLLTGDPTFFEDADSAGALRDLETLLAGAADRLRLDADERAKLDLMVRARVARTARAGWRAAPGAFWRTSPRLAAYGRGRGARAAAVDAAAFAAIYAAAPLLVGGSRVARALARTVAVAPGVRRLETKARRSPILRRVYSWVIDPD